MVLFNRFIHAENIAKALCSFAFLHLAFVISFAQEIKFHHITAEDGLANGNVRAIVQDYQGFFWFGTEDGLQRYDGSNLVEYRHDPTDPSSLASNFIFCLFEDSYHNLWVGDLNGGLCWYDRQADNFRRFTHDPKNPNSIGSNLIRTIGESSDGTLFIGFKDTGFSYFKIPDQITSGIVFTNVDISSKIPGSGWISAIIEEADDAMLIGINGGGINRFTRSTGKLQPVLRDSVSSGVQGLIFDSSDRLWISTWHDGIYTYDHQNQRIAHHIAGAGAYDLKNNQIEKILEDKQGNFWIATDNGLSYLSSDNDPFGDCRFVTYTHNPLEPSSLISNAVKAFYIDSHDRLWIGSYFGGINIYDRNAYKFNPVRSKVWAPHSLADNNVFGFAEDRSGDLWIATDGGGLNYVKGGIANIRKDAFEKIELKILGNPVLKTKYIETDSAGNLWIGTWGSGLFRLDPATGSYEHFGKSGNPANGLLSDEVTSLKTDRQGNLWIGTFDGGVSYFDVRHQKFSHFPGPLSDTLSVDLHHIRTIHIDRRHRVWVAAEVGGLNLYDSVNRRFLTLSGGQLKKDMTVLAIHEDDKGMLWLGTNGVGIMRLDPERLTTQLYDEKSGLANNVVYAILEDASTGHLWISTNKGLSDFNPEKETFANYNPADGLQGNQYNPQSALVCSDGTMLFGGVKGMDAFQPKQIRISTELPEIVFTNFWLYNIEANIGRPGSPLHENIIVTPHIDLAYNQNSFGIEFAMLEYSFSERNNYAYRLDGLDASWQAIGTERKATFTNLDPGRYTFNVKASNSDGRWTTLPRAITITIHPIWWQTLWFKLSVFLLFAVVAIAVVRFRLRYLVKQKRKLKKKVRQRTKVIRQKNNELQERLDEIKSQNKTLHRQTLEIIEKNNEIQSQNEELTSQNDQIMLQRENLREAEQKLREINEQLEALVAQRTEKLEKTIQQLDKTVSELDRFVYSASHDLSAPLKSVLGLVQIARIEHDQERVKEYYDHIEFSIQKLDRVIKSMVEFSRNYHLDIHPDRFNFHDLVEDVLKELAFWPDAKQIIFRNTVPPDAVVNSDSQRMKVVLHNLISNSVKYADLTKAESYIHIDLKKTESGYAISIADNGMGIEAERQSRIFEMYYRATDRSTGSGLGLFIVKEIVLKLGGSIEVKSSFGKGSVFIINIPGSVSTGAS